MTVEVVNVLGVGISAINMEQALSIIEGWIASGQRHYVCVMDVHGVMECVRDPDLRRIHNNAGLVTPDGMPLVWLGWFHGHPAVQRVYGPDLLLALCKLSVGKGLRHYFYGGGDGVPELLAANLCKRFPGLKVVGTFSPPFRQLSTEEDKQIVRQINDANPDIVWVGIGTPKQNRWVAEHLGVVSASVLIGVGAAFDYHSGVKSQAPRWMQRSGLEWFFRLITEPRRLGRRYLVNIPQFLFHVLLQVLRLRNYDLKS